MPTRRQRCLSPGKRQKNSRVFSTVGRDWHRHRCQALATAVGDYLSGVKEQPVNGRSKKGLSSI
jgi:hypothetical protein